MAPPKAGEVRIKIVASGVCHTDAHLLNGVSFGKERFPLILGHEGAGIVESVGEGVTRFKPGDHVLPLYIAKCDKCVHCTQIGNNFCALNRIDDGYVMPDGTTRFSCRGKEVFHFFGTSTFSEYTVCMEYTLAKLSQQAPLEKVCLFACGVSTGYGAALKTACVRRGSRVAIWGLGAVGLSAVIGAREAGAAEIVVIDINEKKFDIARKLGATFCLNPTSASFNETVREKYALGFDFTIECVGKAALIEKAFQLTSAGGGVCTVIGVADSAEIKVNPVELLYAKTLKGSIFGGTQSSSFFFVFIKFPILNLKYIHIGWTVDDMASILDKFDSGSIVIDDLITHQLKLDEIQIAFELMHEGKRYYFVLNPLLLSFLNICILSNFFFYLIFQSIKSVIKMA